MESRGGNSGIHIEATEPIGIDLGSQFSIAERTHVVDGLVTPETKGDDFFGTI